MDAEKFVDAVERFFLDVIGTIIPGLGLLAGVWAIFGPVPLGKLSLAPPTTDTGWTLVVVLSYVLGHGITSMGEKIIVEVVGKGGKKWPLKWFPAKNLDTDQEIRRKIAERATTRAVAEAVLGKGTTPAADDVRMLRNAAMTMAPEGTPTVMRLTFIGLLNLGVATVLWGVATLLLGSRAVHLARVALKGENVQTAGWALATAAGIGVVLFIASMPFLERRFGFYGSSLHLPFDKAAANLAKEKRKKAEEAMPPPPHAVPTVYLSGEVSSGWQENVVNGAPGPVYLNPMAPRLTEPQAHMPWRLAAVRTSDWVFANPANTFADVCAVAFEVGYAQALGKQIIVVDNGDTNSPIAPCLQLLRQSADVPVKTIEEGIQYVKNRVALLAG